MFHPITRFLPLFALLLLPPLTPAQSPEESGTQDPLSPEISSNPEHVLAAASASCEVSSPYQIPCCCHPPCSDTGSACPSFIVPPGNNNRSAATEAHFMSIDGSGHKYCCGNHCPQSNCLIFIRDFLTALEVPLEKQLGNKHTTPLLPGEMVACGPDSTPAACLTYIQSQIESIINPVNLTVANFGNFTDKNAVVDRAREL